MYTIFLKAKKNNKIDKKKKKTPTKTVVINIWVERQLLQDYLHKIIFMTNMVVFVIYPACGTSDLNTLVTVFQQGYEITNLIDSLFENCDQLPPIHHTPLQSF